MTWPRTVTISGKRWKLKRCRLDQHTGGVCDHPDTPHKQILISHNERSESLCRVLIHEILHAADWNRAEESVDQLSADIARIQWQLGLRWSEEFDS